MSDGSPISPPFLDPHELAVWMKNNDDSITSDMSIEEWEKFILGDGWAPSMVISGGIISSGAKAVVSQ